MITFGTIRPAHPVAGHSVELFLKPYSALSQMQKFVLIVGLLFVLVNAFCSQLYAKEKSKSVSEVISEAKGMAEKGERLKVSILLKNEIKKKYSSKIEAQVKEALLLLTDTFYSEEALQLFQQAEGIRFENVKAAESKYLEALVKEPLQPKVLRALAHSYLIRGECKEAHTQILKLLSLIPFDSVGLLLSEYEPLCQKQVVNIEQLEKKKFESPTDQMLFKHLLALFALQQNKLLEAREFLKAAKAIDHDFPEIYHAEHKLSEMSENPLQEVWQKYKSMCLNISPKQALKYRWGYKVCDKDVLSTEQVENGGEKGE